MFTSVCFVATLVLVFQVEVPVGYFVSGFPSVQQLPVRLSDVALVIRMGTAHALERFVYSIIQ